MKKPLYRLKELARTGHMGEVTIGMDADKVTQILGPPDYSGCPAPNEAWDMVWRYGDFELGFDPDPKQVHYMGMSFWDDHLLEQGVNVTFDPWILSAKLRPDEWLQACDQEQILCKPIAKPINDFACEMVTEGGMYLLFIDRDEGTNYTLEKFNVVRFPSFFFTDEAYAPPQAT